MRSHICHGEPPHNCAASVFERLTLTGHLQPEDNLTSDELRYLQEKLYDGYFAFEALTRIDWDSAINFVESVALHLCLKAVMETARTLSLSRKGQG